MTVRGIAFPFPLIVFSILAVFYTFHSIDYAVSRDFLFYLISYLVIFFLLVQTTSPKKKEARWIALTVAILGIVTSIYGLYQYLWGFEDILDKTKGMELFYPSPLREEIISRLEGGRIFATFLLPSHCAAFLGITIPLSGAFILTSKGWLRCLFGLAAVVQIVALYLTKSFSGWLSLILASACFVLIYLGYIKRVRIRYLAYSLGSLFLVLVLIFAGLSLTRPDNPLASISNNPLVLRALNWGTTIEMIGDNPWVGKGLHTFGLIYLSYQRPGVNIVHHAHNTYLQLGVEMGIIGTAVFLWFACWWFWRTVRLMKKTKDKTIKPWLGSFMIAGTAFFIHHAFDFEFYLPSVTLAGFAVLASAIGIQKKGKIYKLALQKNRRPLFTAAGFIATMAASLFLLIPFYGQRHFQEARSLINADRPYFAGRSFIIEEAAAELKKAIRLDPCNSEYHHRYGVLLVQKFAQTQEGIAEVQEAIRLSPWRHYYYFDLGMIYWRVTGEKDKARDEIKKASQLYPLNEDYHQRLRKIYLTMGKKELAAQEERCIDKIRGQKGD